MLGNVIHKVHAAIGRQGPDEDTGWVDTLAGMTELDALIEIKDKLSKIDFLKTAKLKSHVDLVLDVDEKTYQKVKKIIHNYLISLKNNRGLKKDTQVVVYEYHRQLYLAYGHILDAYQNQNKLKLDPDKVNLLLARYLNATFVMAKWRYFDDQPAPAGTWDNVHKVIKIAEDLAMMNKNVFLYDFQIKETSVASILKRGFMLNTLQKGSYSQLQIELTDRVLKIWATNPLLVQTYKQDRYQFFIPLDSDRGPERVRVIEEFASCRYWKTTRLVDLMEAYLCAAGMNKSLKAFGLEKMTSPPVLTKLFKKLRVEWCVEGYSRQRRSETRSQKHNLLNVSHGIREISQRLRNMQTKQSSNRPEGGNFTFELQLATHRPIKEPSGKVLNTVGNENWCMVDESSNGFAVDFGKEFSDWIESGVLVGYTMPEDKQALSIAEVKSVRKQADGTYRAGFKVVSHQAKAVEVSRTNKSSTFEAVTGYYLDDGEERITHLSTFLGLFIDGDEATDESNDKASKKSNMPTLIIPRKEYKRGNHYNINIDGDDHMILPGRVLDKHRDWICFEALF